MHRPTGVGTLEELVATLKKEGDNLKCRSVSRMAFLLALASALTL